MGASNMHSLKSLALVAIILSSITLIAWLAVKETESNPNVGVQSLETPDWVKKAVFYQIFPERFRDGNSSNNAKTGDVLWKNDMWSTYAYSKPWGGTPTGNNDWFGGDLQGVAEKASYLADLGITAIWFNPTMDSTDNHGYTVIDYKSVNRYFGINHRVGTKVIPDYNASTEVFRNMTAALDEYGINVVLDGVFNHCSAKNKWFDIDNDYPTDGAYESNMSQWYDWFVFTNWPHDYKCWYGYKAMPEPEEDKPDSAGICFKDYIYRANDSVIKFWNDLGVDGWRLDCGVDVSHEFWKEFRTHYKGLNPDGFILGEYWGDARDWLQGDQWDSVMNYPFRTAVLNWAKGGGVSTFDSTLRNIKSWYSEEEAFYTLFNILDSHDVTRALSELGENKTKMKLAVIFQMTYPGVPVVYYGDEVGMTGVGDPGCRRTYPWPDKGGSPDMDMLNHYKRLIAIRKGYPVLSVGSLQTNLVDNAKKVYVLARKDNSSRAILVYNNGNLTQTVNVTVSDLGLADGSTLTDVLNNEVYTVSGGKVTVQTRGMWASILISPSVFPCDSTGSPKDGFHEEDYVYCQGSGFPNNTNVRIYVTTNKTWANGEPITDVRTTGYNETTTDSNGNLNITCLGLAGNLSYNELPAYYDVIVDVDCDGTFDAGIDTVDDITYFPGITVPETMPIGGGIAIIFTIYLIAIITTKRKLPRPRA